MQETCKEIESQASDFEKLYEKRKTEYERLLKDKVAVQKERDALKIQVSQLNSTIAGEKNRADLLVKDLNSKVQSLESLLSTEKDRVKSLSRELDQEKKKGEANNRRVLALEQELDRCVQEANTADERSAQLEEEIREIKEEAARHISEILNQKSRCKRLQSSLAEANEQIETLQARIDSLLTEMDKNKKQTDNEIYSLTERLRQHHDLENEMMRKIEKLEKSKKPLIGINSPLPISKPRTTGFIRDVREFETELEKEKEKSRQLQRELYQREAELLELRNKYTMKKIHPKTTDDDEHLDSSSPDSDPSAPPPPSYFKYSLEHDTHSTTGSSSNVSVISSDHNDVVPSDEDDEDTTLDGQENHSHHHTVSVDVHQAASSTMESSKKYLETIKSFQPSDRFNPYRQRVRQTNHVSDASEETPPTSYLFGSRSMGTRGTSPFKRVQ